MIMRFNDAVSGNSETALQKSKKRIEQLEKELEGYRKAEKEYKETIEEFQQKETVSQEIFDSLPIGIMIVDEDSTIWQVNRTLQKRIMKDKQELTGKKGGEGILCYYSIDEECGKGIFCSNCPIRKNVKKVFKTNNPVYELEVSLYVLAAEKPRMVWIRLNIFPIKIKENQYAVLTIENIEKEKINVELKKQMKNKEEKLLELERYDQLRNEFFANVSHELKTPLNIILGTIQLFEDVETEKRFGRYIKIIRQNCFRLLKLINNIIDIARIDLGFFDLNLRNENIIAIIKETTYSTMVYAKSRGIELRFDTDIEKKIIACDAEKIERVLLNLLSNAIRYSSENGSIAVRVYEKSGSVYISVKDTGVGIPAEMLKEIFKLFRQVESSFDKNNEGTGIGLFIVKSIIDLHGGTICVKSEVNKGSEFIIELPSRIICQPEYVKDSKYEYNSEKLTIEFSDIK